MKNNSKCFIYILSTLSFISFKHLKNKFREGEINVKDFGFFR